MDMGKFTKKIKKKYRKNQKNNNTTKNTKNNKIFRILNKPNGEKYEGYFRLGEKYGRGKFY